VSRPLPDVATLARAAGLDLPTARRVLAVLDPTDGAVSAGRPGGTTAGEQTTEQHTPVPETELIGGTTFVFEVDEQATEGDAAVGRTLDVDRRYEDRGLLGRGGMGEVRRVWDRQLERTVAMKILDADPTLGAARFVEEARTIAGLQHPGVLAVHEIGRLPDNRMFFTMMEIRGQTLRDHVKAVHRESPDVEWGATVDGWSFRRLVSAYQDLCDAVAYAHSEGLVHRDLKPRNVMVGAHGEVMVVDWGLARRKGSVVPEGTVVGTPAYLAPELLRDKPPAVHPRTDVYALGAILYYLLTGRAPFGGADATEIMDRVRAGPSPLPESGRPIPDELLELCVRAMAREPAARVGHAGVLAVAVRTWLDGSRKRSRASEMVQRARAIMPEVRALREQARAVESRAGAALAAIEPWAPEEHKHAAWQGLDQAQALREAAELRDSEAALMLQGALTVDPTLPDTHVALAERCVTAHKDAVARGQDADATAVLNRLRRHVDALPAHHPRRPALIAWHRGEGAVSLHTDPPGAWVSARPLIDAHRRLVPGEPRDLGPTPLDAVPLGHGSWLLEVHADGRLPLRVPVAIGRGEHWQGIPPDADAPQRLRLPLPDELGPDDCQVPAGWTTVGGDALAYGSADRRRLWVPGFVVERFPVTNVRYIAFLDDLVDRGDEALALSCMPRERSGAVAVQGAPIYARDDRGHFLLQADSHGDVWRPDQPVIMIEWHGAAAFARWQAARTGLPWRLLSEWEWEKAARGVDARPYPWGHFFDPSRACTRLSHAGHPLPADVDSFPVDESIYGVRGLAGNVRDWCLDPFVELPPPQDSRLDLPVAADPSLPRVNRGGFWLGNDRDARAADRHFHVPTHRAAEVGFRLARPWPGDSP